MPDNDRERRQRTLTDADMTAISEMIQTHSKCALGINQNVARALNELTPEELGMFKRGMKIVGNAANLIGATILVALVGILIALFTKGFWITLISGVKEVPK